MPPKRKHLVVISDVHAHPWSAFSKGAKLGNSRLLQTIRVLRRSLIRARDLNAIWVCPGDIVHTHGSVQNVVLSLLTETFTGFEDIPKIAVWGNHDARGVGGKITLEETVWYALKSAIRNLRVLDEETWTSPDGINFYGAGYQPKIEDIDLGEDPCDVGIFHQTVQGTKNAFGFEFEDGLLAADLNSRYPTVLVGHVHHPAHYADTANRTMLLVPGSPEQHNFGDAGDHGLWVLTLEQDEENGRWHTVKAEMEESGSPSFLTVNAVEEVRADGNFYRVVGASIRPQDLPENAVVVGVPPTVVAERNLLKGGFDPEHVLRVWMQENPVTGRADAQKYLEAGLQLLRVAEPTYLQDYRLVRVRAENFGSFRELEHEILPGVRLVVGRGKDFQSNGAGKTTMFEAIYWALFGETTRGQSGDEIVHWHNGAKEAEVELWLDSGDDQHRIRVIRTRKMGGSSTFNVLRDGVPVEGSGALELTRKLCNILGITKEIFRVLAYFSQEALLLFSKATDGERKNIIKDLIGSETYQKAATAAGQEHTRFNDEVGKLLSRIMQVEADMPALREKRAEHAAHAIRWEEEQARALASLRGVVRDWEDMLSLLRARLSAKLDRIKARVPALQEAAQDRKVAFVERIRQEYEERETRLVQNQLTERQQRIVQIVEEMRKEFGSLDRIKGLLAVLPAIEQKAAQASETVRALRTAYSTIEDRVRRADRVLMQQQGRVQQTEELVQSRRAMLREFQQALSAGICPTCKQAYSGDELRLKVADGERRVDEAEESLRTIKWSLEGLASELASVQRDQVDLQQQLQEAVEEEGRQKQVWEELQRAKRQMLLLEDAQTALRQTQAHLNEVKALAGKRAELDADQAFRRTLARIERRVDSAETYARRKLQEVEGNLQRSRRELAETESRTNPYHLGISQLDDLIQQQEDQVRNLHTQVDTLSLDMAMYAYWSKAFSKQGIQSLLMDEVAGAFNACRSEVFPVLTKGVYDVQFSTISHTKAGEAREKTDFLVWQNGKAVPYESLSGGQRRRVDLGVMLTLALATARRQNVPGVLGLMVFDEVFGFLDDDGAETLYDTLLEVQRTIPAIYAVTHDSHLQSMFPEVLRVEQDEQGVSHLLN